jgi:hypothetical protein
VRRDRSGRTSVKKLLPPQAMRGLVRSYVTLSILSIPIHHSCMCVCDINFLANNKFVKIIVLAEFVAVLHFMLKNNVYPRFP